MTRFFITFLLSLFLYGLAHSQEYFPPHESVKLAYQHITKHIPPERRQYIRYFDMYNLPPQKREEAFLIMSGHMQHLSRSFKVFPVHPVPGTGGGLLYINLKEYRIDTNVWEQLAQVDPYFHINEDLQEVITQKVPYPLKNVYLASDGKRYGQAEDGKWYEDGKFFTDSIVSHKIVKKFAHAPWLSIKYGDFYLKGLLKETYSEVPIVRGNWFFNQTAAAEDRKPNYYDFLGIKSKKDFDKIIGFDNNLFKEILEVGVRASVGKSGVTLKPRAIVRKQSLTNGLWISVDFRKLKNETNPLDVLGENIEKNFDASEVFGGLPNGFWVTGLFNQKGEIQATAPPFIASDKLTKSNDTQVHVNVSCIRCHYEGGLKPIQDWTRNLIQPPLKLNIWNYDPIAKKYLHEDDIIRLREEYTRHLDDYLKQDRIPFERAVKEATGWTGQIYSKKYAEFWESYEDKYFYLNDVAYEVGIPPDKLKDAVIKSVLLQKGDQSLSDLILDKRKVGIPLEVYLLKYSTIQNIVYEHYWAPLLKEGKK